MSVIAKAKFLTIFMGHILVFDLIGTQIQKPPINIKNQHLRNFFTILSNFAKFVEKVEHLK